MLTLSGPASYDPTVADRDVFAQHLGRRWSKVGRQLGDRRVAALTAAQTACHAINGTLNDGGGIPRPVFLDLCSVIAEARDNVRRRPLFEDPSRQYDRRKQIREICRADPDLKLGRLLVEAASRVLVDERAPVSAELPSVRIALARAIAIELFDERCAGPLVMLLQSQGFLADEARQRVDECRSELVTLGEFDRLTSSLAHRPDAKQRRIRAPQQVKTTTAALLFRPVVGSLSATQSGDA